MQTLHRVGLTAVAVCLIWLGRAAAESRAAAPAKVRPVAARRDLALFQQQHADLHGKFVTALDALATECEEKQLPLEAGDIRAFGHPVDMRVLHVQPLPAHVQPELPADLAPDARHWRAQLKLRRQDYAKQLYQLSRRVLNAGYISYAYDLVNEIARQDPDHSQARRLLGYERFGDEWVTPYAAQMLRKKFVWHAAYGWIPHDHLERYEAGERYYKRRWMSAAEEDVLRSDFANAWEIRTDHYLITTNHSLERGVQLGQQLESYYRIFFQTFAGFFNTRDQLRQLFESTAPKSAAQARTFKVHYYRTRDEYNRRLKGKIAAPIEITTGLYLTGQATAYFFDDPEAEVEVRTTLFHEATHQLFSETRPSARAVGTRGDFWIIEGIACYLESFQQEGERFTLGNPNYIRFRAAQYRGIEDQYYIPLEKFSAMGMVEFQGHKEISKNYSEASGLAHFFMHYEDGLYREALIDHLSDIYSTTPRVREQPRSLEELTGVPYAELDRQYLRYLAQLNTNPQSGAGGQ